MLGLALLLTASLASAAEVKITWVGQSCFIVQSSEGRPTIITDPPAAAVGYTLPAIPADVVTISHNHSDHNNAAGVRGEFTLVDGRNVTERREVSAAGITFTLIPSFHDNQGGSLRGSNTIIRWTQSGISFAHMGDYGEDRLSDRQAADLRGLDVLFIPAGGFFTVDARQAAEMIRQLRPRIAILMHYRTALGGPAQLAAFPAVAEPFPELVYRPATVSLRREELPASTQVWLMEPAADAVAVNAASFAAGMPVAPGSLVTVFGNLSGARTEAAQSPPLPRRLADVEVLVDGEAAPLLFVSPAQINFQMPFSQPVGQPRLDVRLAGQARLRTQTTVVTMTPGLFVAVNEDGRLNSAAAPARRGQRLIIYGTGQGEVRPAVPDGEPAPSVPLSVTPWMPDVFIGGKAAPVEFSGLAPGWAGLWQINVVIPADAPTGTAVPLMVKYGLTSNTLPLVIQ